MASNRRSPQIPIQDRIARKPRRVRPRYVVFEARAPEATDDTRRQAPSRNQVLAALRGVIQSQRRGVADLDALRVIDLDARGGIARIGHQDAAALCEALASIRWIGPRKRPYRAIPVVTSGTLRAARRARRKTSRASIPAGSETI